MEEEKHYSIEEKERKKQNFKRSLHAENDKDDEKIRNEKNRRGKRLQPPSHGPTSIFF